MAISGIGNFSNINFNKRSETAKNGKPSWDGKKAYKYLEDMSDAAISYGIKAQKYYATKTMEDGEMSVADLKKQIGEMFSDYTLTDHEPRDVVSGKHYLYIDNSQLKKMASDPGYRAKVYGLMDREMEVGREWTMTYSDGRNVTSHITGSIFSLSEVNRKYAGADGIPYRGSCTSDHPWSSSDSHPQVRNQSFLYDNLDPEKSARKSRINAAKSMAVKVAKKKEEKKVIEKRAAEKKQKIKQQERIAEKREKEEAYFQEMLDASESSLLNYTNVGDIMQEGPMLDRQIDYMI
ncbi:MAG: hypothetical protein MJ110_01910 [Lachnospiraceae bacterium]|nr:hypothetical protein [Lachnospiraceae bacterium]